MEIEPEKGKNRPKRRRPRMSRAMFNSFASGERGSITPFGSRQRERRFHALNEGLKVKRGSSRIGVRR